MIRNPWRVLWEKKISSVGHRLYVFSSDFFFRAFYCVALFGLKIPSAGIKGLQLHTWHNSMLFNEYFDSVELVIKGQVSGNWFW